MKSVYTRKIKVLGLLVLGALLSAPAGRALADDVVPFFRPDVLPQGVVYGPDLPDPVATECGARDKACIAEHDARVLRTALAEKLPFACGDSTAPKRCLAVLYMVLGEVGTPPDLILDDPCSQVIRVDGNIATVRSDRRGISRRYVDRGWTAGQFLGPCSSRPVTASGPEVPMPSWSVPAPKKTERR